MLAIEELEDLLEVAQHELEREKNKKVSGDIAKKMDNIALKDNHFLSLLG